MMMRRRHAFLAVVPFVPMTDEYDPRAAEFDDVDYSDVFAELATQPDLDEPTRPFGEYGR